MLPLQMTILTYFGFNKKCILSRYMDPYLSHAKNTTFEHTFLGVKLWQVNVQIEAILAAIDF